MQDVKVTKDIDETVQKDMQVTASSYNISLSDFGSKSEPRTEHY